MDESGNANEYRSVFSERSKKRRRRSMVERLENRCLLSVYNPQLANPLSPAPVENVPLADNLILATFDSFDPVGGLTATVSFNGSPPIAANVVATPNNGAEFVPGVGTVPQYFVQLPPGSYTPTQAGAGALHYVVSVADAADSTSNTLSGGADVQDAPLTLNSTLGGLVATAGTTLTNQPLAVFTDPSSGATPSSFNGTIDWGDGTPLSSATFVPLGSGQFVVEGSHTYARPLTTNISVKVDDIGGSSIVGQTGPVTISDAAIDTPITSAVNGMQGQLLNNVPLLTFVSHNPLAFAGMFTAQINWGDGHSSVGLVTAAGGGLFSSNFIVTGSHTYTYTPGSPFNITIGVSDLFGGSLPPQSTTANIIQSPLTVSVQSLNTNVGESTSVGDTLAIISDASGPQQLDSYSATIKWGDGSPDSNVDGTQFIQDIGGTLDVPDPGHVYAGPGLYPITVIVNQGEEAVGSGGGFAFVNGVGTSIHANPVGSISSVEGTPIPANTAVAGYSIDNAPSTTDGLSAVIDWGDGSPTSLGTIVSAGSGKGVSTFTVQGGHVYSRLGVYTITTTFTDTAHDTLTTTNQATIADAPLGSGKGQAVVGNVGQSLVNVPVATFADPNPFAQASDIAAVINWGDGSSSRGTLTPIGAAGRGVLFSVSGSHAYAAPLSGATYTVTSVVVEPRNPSNLLTIATTATLTGQAQPEPQPRSDQVNVSVFPVIAIARNPLSLPARTIIATFSNSAGESLIDTFSALISWGDGAVSRNAPIIPLGGGVYGVLGGHTYKLKGTYAIRVAVQLDNPATHSSVAGYGANLATVNPRHRARRLETAARELSNLHSQRISHHGTPRHP